MEMTIGKVEMPKKKSEVFREMKIGESIEITDTNKRESMYAWAKRCCPKDWEFVTRTMDDGTVRLFRTA